MTRNRHAMRRHSLGHASCAVQLLAGAGLLTLMPSVMAESPLTQALQYAQPLTWVMLAAGAGVLLTQRWLGGRRAPSVGIAEAVRDRQLPENAAANTARPNPSRLDSGVLRRIPEQRFEAVIEALFARSGYLARSRTRLPEGGVDVELEPQGAGERQAGILRCRQRAGRTVSVDEIRDLEQAMASRGARGGHFATTSLLTPDAIAFARSRGIQLLDVDGILRMAAKLSAPDQQVLLTAAAEDDSVAARATVVHLPESLRASQAAARAA